ncbi:unnamed protein product, partial [Chrysoparadoxa australica]
DDLGVGANDREEKDTTMAERNNEMDSLKSSTKKVDSPGVEGESEHKPESNVPKVPEAVWELLGSSDEVSFLRSCMDSVGGKEARIKSADFAAFSMISAEPESWRAFLNSFLPAAAVDEAKALVIVLLSALDCLLQPLSDACYDW